MVSDSLISLSPVVREIIAKSWNSVRRSDGVVRLPRTPLTPTFSGSIETNESDENIGDFEPSERLVPTRWVLWGLGSSVAAGTFLVWIVFGAEGIKPWATIIGFLMGGLLSILG